MSRANCEAHQERDGTHYCGRCGLRWDNDSIDPPECLSDLAIKSVDIRKEASTQIELREAGVVVTQEEQDEINRRGMAKLRETLNYE